MFLLRKHKESSKTEIMKKLRKFHHWARNISYKKNVYIYSFIDASVLKYDLIFSVNKVSSFKGFL